MKIAVVLPNWVGDAVMATPALRALRDRFPQAHVAGILKPPIHDVLDGTGLLDQVIFDQTRTGCSWRERLNFVWELRRQQFDRAVLLTNSFRPALYTWLAGCRERIGMSRNGRGFLLTQTVPSPPKKVPTSALTSYLKIVDALGAATDNKTITLATNSSDEEQLQRVIEQHPVLRNGYIAFNSGGAFGAAKEWPLGSFVSLAQRVVNDIGKPVLMLCGPAEQDLAKEFVRQSHSSMVVSLAEQTLSIGLSKAAVKHADLMVTTDSGPRHFAAGFNTPVITLFGPTHIGWSETDFPKAVHIQHQVDCGPCQQRVCPLGHHRCMQDLSVDQVYDEVSRLLSKTANRQPQSLAG